MCLLAQIKKHTKYDTLDLEVTASSLQWNCDGNARACCWSTVKNIGTENQNRLVMMLRELQYLCSNTVQSDLFMYLFIHSAFLARFHEVRARAISPLKNSPVFVKTHVNRPSPWQRESKGGQ